MDSTGGSEMDSGATAESATNEERAPSSDQAQRDTDPTNLETGTEELKDIGNTEASEKSGENQVEKHAAVESDTAEDAITQEVPSRDNDSGDKQTTADTKTQETGETKEEAANIMKTSNEAAKIENDTSVHGHGSEKDGIETTSGHATESPEGEASEEATKAVEKSDEDKQENDVAANTVVADSSKPPSVRVQENDEKAEDNTTEKRMSANGKTAKESETQKKDEHTGSEDSECGLGPCRPKSLQCCARLIFFTLALSFAGFCSHAIGPFFVSQVTSIERQFELNSTQIGGLMSANDITFLAVVLLVSHFCKNSHVPRILAGAYVAFGFSCIVIALMYFASPRTLKDVDAGGRNRARNNTKYLCILGATDRAFDEGCGEGEEGDSGSNMPLVVFFGLMLGVQGISKATRSPLGTTYIDNNVPNKSRTGFHVGLMFTLVLMGPAVGFAMGGVFNRIPVDLSDTSLSSRDPRWIGAWWIGFLVVGVTTLMAAFPLFCFPRRMPHRAGPSETDKGREYVLSNPEKVEETTYAGDSQDSTTVQTDSGTAAQVDGPQRKTSANSKTQDNSHGAQKLKTLLKDLPLSIFRLIKKPTFIIILFTLGVQIFAVMGYASFLIKYVERQFGLPAWKSSSIFGLCNLVFGGLGTFSGGLIVSRLNLTRRGCLRWVVFASTMSTVMSAINMFLGCDNEPIVGLQRSEYVLDDGQTLCHCSHSQFLPVCDGHQSFLSPCHAGCSRAANSTVYEGCFLAEPGHVTVGLCSPSCTMLIPFIVVQTMSTFIGTSAITPVFVTVLRSAEEKDKTLAMGMLSFVMSLMGFIPAPIVYGAVIDTACVLWSSTCGRQGACALYDVNLLRQRYIGLEVGAKALGVIGYVVALMTLTWQVHTGRDTDEKMRQDQEKTVADGGIEEKVDECCSNGSETREARGGIIELQTVRGLDISG